MAHTITNDNLQELLDSGKPLVIDFWAQWCGPCRMIGPIIEELSEQYKDQAVIGKCDIEENNDVAVKYGIRQIPTVIFIKNGEVVERHTGAAPRNVLEDKLAKIL